MLLVFLLAAVLAVFPMTAFMCAQKKPRFRNGIELTRETQVGILGGKGARE